MRAEGGEDDPLTLLLCHHHQDQEKAEDCNLIRRTWLDRIAMFSVTVITQSFAGHLSDLDLTAISIVTTVIISISFGFMLGMASALETLCGQAYGAKQYRMLGIYMQRSWVVLFLCSLLLLPLFVFATPLLKLIGQTDAVAEQTGLVALWSIPFHLSFPFQMTLQRFLQSQLKMGVIAWVSGGVLALHVFVSWLFVLKLEVGIVGTTLTIGFAWWVSVVALFAYTVCGGCPETWTGFAVQAFLGLWDFFKLAVASGVMLLLENFYYRCLVIMSGFMNNAEISIEALSICMTIYAWESMIPLGFLAATGPSLHMSNPLIPNLILSREPTPPTKHPHLRYTHFVYVLMLHRPTFWAYSIADLIAVL
ncbi:hypothetical protein DVH24_016748 [Malus domestica]|uniref:Protein DETOXIFICATION n=1 Tax=Malus domestica TaxID=3750 RepID=A0A498HR36_MALDO|nr:hypothetical protein DVH24_016748 [Malus domestica]